MKTLQREGIQSIKCLHIVIDSNWLRKDRSLDKEHLLFMKELSRLGVIKLHFPYFIYSECISASIDLVETKINTAISSLKSLEKQGLGLQLINEINFLGEELERHKSKISESIKSKWQDYFTESNAIVHRYNPSDSIVVFQNYFKGDKPFSSLKSRKDIPDAFIFEALKDIAKSNEIHFISDDDGFRSKCEGEKNIFSYKGFDEFYKSDFFKPINIFYETKKNISVMKKLIFEDFENIKDLIEEELYENFEKREVVNIYIPSEDNEGVIIAIKDISSILVQEHTVKKIDDNVYFNIDVVSNCLIDYLINYSEQGSLTVIRKLIEVQRIYDSIEIHETYEFRFNLTVKTPSEDVLEKKISKLQIEDIEIISLYPCNLRTI